MDKRQLRASVRSRVSSLSADEKTLCSERTCRLAGGLPEWKAAKNVMLFMPMPDEIDVRPLIQEARKAGKKVYIPKVEGSEIAVYEYSEAHLASGAFGILEPAEGAVRLCDLGRLDLVIVPGVAFTAEGQRLGRGKGFYDRFLPKTVCPHFGIAFPQQIVPSLPTDPWDVPLDGVIFLTQLEADS